ncbi:hypothetical protein [Anatilimnocola floriformis]|uniref:hypothetical protein n=1 Tax=Anatilimnocola floriformis TaxID=2948575 RepID=UPI0020C3F120|nr:hypothetical protein [Anatilimnocola floriformis]
MSRRGSPAELRLNRSGNTLSADAGVHLFASRMQTDQLVFNPRLQQVVSQTESLIPVDGLQRANAGLEMAIRFIGVLSGFVVSTQEFGAGRATLSEPACEIRPTVPPIDRALVDFVYRNELGLVRVGNGVDAACLVAQLVRAVSEATFVIIVGTHAEKRMWRRRLRSLEISFKAQAIDCLGQSVKQVVVATPAGAAEDEVSFHSRHIAIFPNAIASVGERFQDMLLCADARARLIGFVRTDVKESPREEDLLRAQFGFAELTIPAHGRVLTDIRTVRVLFRTKPLPHNWNGRQLRQKGIWCHPVRNRWIARLAKIICHQDWCAFREWQPILAEQLIDQISPNVIVMAESVPQAIAIARRMEEAPLVIDSQFNPDLLEASDRELMQRRPIGWNIDGPLIATPVGLTRISPRRAQTIIWAGSGPYAPPLPVEYLSGRNTDQHRVTLIDFDDQHHAVLRRQSQLRGAAYRNAGWCAPAADPEAARIRQFLASRPMRSRR